MKKMDREAAEIIGGCLGGTIVMALVGVFFLFLGAVAMALWNTVVVGLFGVSQIDYWMGLGIVGLLTFLGAFLNAANK